MTDPTDAHVEQIMLGVGCCGGLRERATGRWFPCESCLYVAVEDASLPAALTTLLLAFPASAIMEARSAHG